MRGIVARAPSTIQPVSIPLLLGLVLVVVIACVGYTAYRRQESRTPHLRALTEHEVTIDELPPGVQKALADPKHRAALATSMRKIARDAARAPRRKIIAPPPVTHYFPAEVRQEISDVADLIERPETPPEAIALAEILIGDGHSPFYGDRTEPLERELRRLMGACQTTSA
jgi:hypothetical protein